MYPDLNMSINDHIQNQNSNLNSTCAKFTVVELIENHTEGSPCIIDLMAWHILFLDSD
jgi:hypothetical protein